MTNAELAERLNFELGLAGKDAVTVDVIRKWVRWQVLPKARATETARGRAPKWDRGQIGYQRARKLVEWKSAGVRSKTAFIMHAYIEWGSIDLEAARDALNAEFRKAFNVLVKRLTSDTNFKNYSEISASREKALRHQAGPLDDRFKGAKFEQTSKTYISALSFMRGDQIKREIVEKLINNGLKQAFSELPEGVSDIISEITTSAIKGLLDEYTVRENPKDSVIFQSTPRQYRIARVRTRKWIKIVRGGQAHISEPIFNTIVQESTGMLSPLAPQITSGLWLASIFVAFLNMQRNLIPGSLSA